MNTLRTALVLAFALALSGCFQTKTLVRLNADGSGTVQETVLMNSAIQAAVMGGMGMGMASGVERDSDTPYILENLQARAGDLGATFVGVEEQDLLFGDGYIATYSFEDINTLRLTSDPSAFLPDELREEMNDDMGGQEQEPIVFAYRNGELLITLPPPDLDGEDDEEIEEITLDLDDPGTPRRDPKKQQTIYEESDDELGMGSARDEGMAMLFRDMRFTLTVELPGEVAETNASFLDGRTLTLYDMDFEAMIEEPGSFERLEQLSPGGPPSSAAAMRLLSELPGIRYEPAETVTVTLR